MSKQPKITIILATYNRSHLIEETLVSIQNQTYTNWECLIIDDGGTDNTKEVIDSFFKNDSRFQFTKRPNSYKKGLPGCRNYGLDIARGEWVVFFDDDDIVHPQNLELCIEVLKINNCDFCVYNKQSFSGSFTGNIYTQKPDIDKKDLNLFNFITNKEPIASCTVMWHVSCFDNIRFNEALMYAEEWECYTRIFTTNKKSIFLKNILYFNRKHTQSNTGEFWNNDPVRRASKVEACRLVIDHLAQKKLLSYRLGVYFVSLALFYKEKQIYNFLKTNKEAFNTFENLMLKLRYYANGLISPFYKLKKRIALKS